MITASVSKSKATLSALLTQLKAGETVTITDRGVPVAKLVHLDGGSTVDWDARLERLERARLVRRPRERLERGWLSRRPLPESRESAPDVLLEERRDDLR